MNHCTAAPATLEEYVQVRVKEELNRGTPELAVRLTSGPIDEDKIKLGKVCYIGKG